jgi:hypothetical protein
VSEHVETANHESKATSSERKKDRRKGQLLYVGSAAVAVAVGAFELSKGLPRGMLGLVANGAHEYSDAAVRTLQGIALSAKFSGSRRLNKGAAGVVLTGSAITLGQNVFEFADAGLAHLTNIDPKPMAPHFVGMGGNIVAGGLALKGATYAEPTKAEHTRRHVAIDLKKSAWLLAASASGVTAIDAAASLKLGVVESAQLGSDMLRHADRPVDEIDHHHGHAHEHTHTPSTKRSFRQRVNEAGILVSAKALTTPQNLVSALQKSTTKENSGGERRYRWGRIAVGVGTCAVGAYMATKFGIFESASQSADRLAPNSSGSPVFEQPLLPPDPPTEVQLEAGSNPWHAVGEYSQSLGFQRPNLQEHDALKDEVVKLLSGRDATTLRPGEIISMPTRTQVELIYAAH